MNLKHAILEELTRDSLKQICERLEINDVDRRSAEAMRTRLSRLRRARPEVLLGYLREDEVKAVAEVIGMNPRGRKNQLIEKLLAGSGSGQSAEDGAAKRAAGGKRGMTRTAAMAEEAEQYRHKEEAVQRPDVGVQDQFQAKRPAKTYRYDSSLDPALSWDEQCERALGEWLLGLIERAAKEGEAAVFGQVQEWEGGGVRVASTVQAIGMLKSVSKPFLNWAGKAERHQIERRLFYVAVTRAQKFLHMTWAPTPGNKQAQAPSDFFIEVLASKYVKRRRRDYADRQRLVPTPRASVANVVLSQHRHIGPGDPARGLAMSDRQSSQRSACFGNVGCLLFRRVEWQRDDVPGRAARQLFYFLANRIDGKSLAAVWEKADLGIGKRALATAVAKATEARDGMGKADVAQFQVYNLQRQYMAFLDRVGLREEQVPGGRGEVVFYNLGKFSQAISDFESIHFHSEPVEKYASFSKFLEYQAENAYPEGWQDSAYATPDAVQIMTVHQAKGLQWPAVFVPQLVRNRFPSRGGGGRTSWHLLPATAFENAQRYMGSVEDASASGFSKRLSMPVIT
jgi:hypothetical protein